jgi:SPW repeat
MTNDLDVNDNLNPVTTSTAVHSTNAAKAASAICMLAGIWLFVSPWIYGAGASAWNSWIVGAAVFMVGLVRMSTPLATAGLSWLNMVLGIWVFFSPWIYGYVGNEGRFINSLCVGVIVFVLSIASVLGSRHRTAAPITRM